MDIQALIVISIISAIILTVYSFKLQANGEMVIFGDWFDIVIASGIAIFPLIAILINNHNTALILLSVIVPLLMSFKTSFTNNPDNIFYALLSFISKISIVTTIIFILLILFFCTGTKRNNISHHSNSVQT